MSNAQKPTAINSEQVEARLQQRISATWRSQQLGTIIQKLVDTQDLPLWIDRRVDLQQSIDLRVTDTTILETLELLAKQYGLGVTLIESVIYVGPKKSASELQTLSKRTHNSLEKIPAASKKRWLRNTPSNWPRLSVPKTLLVELLSESNFKLSGADKIPHDLWAAKQLPPVSLVDRVVLILVGFDLTCKITADGKTCEVVPIKHPVTLEHSYKLSRESLRKIKRAMPDRKFRVAEKTLSFTGSWEDHLRIQELLGKRTLPTQKPATRRAARTEKKFSLQLQNQPVGVVIEQLAKQLKLVVVWNEASLATADISKDTPVSCQVKNADLDELLESILSPAGLQHEHDGNRLNIKARP